MPEQPQTVEEKLRRRECELEMLKEITRVISRGQSLQEVFSFVTDSARELLNAETATMPIISDDQSSYVYRAASGKNAEELTDAKLPLTVGLCGWVLRNQRPWWRGSPQVSGLR